ncbi:MAG: protein kinase domain-containing protein [Sulfurifustis sp.]
MAEAKIDIQIPGHRLLRQLGSGGMANVYLALQESMEREVALKVMHPSLGLTDPAFSERFIREAKIVAKLSHPHINAVFDVGVAGAYHYFTMEYLTGGDLKSRIRRGMPPRAVLTIVRQMASALAFAHSKGYVHRDVKPENVLFRDSSTAVLTDFGIAKANDVASGKTATGTIIGTPYYMSPEQALARPVDGRSDLYSLGAMAFEMLTGRVLYDGDSAVSIGIKHVKDPIPPLPPPLQMYQPLLDKFLAKEPAHRFQTGEEAMDAIDAVMGGTSLPNASSTVVVSAAERTMILAPDAATAAAITGVEPPKRRRGVIVAAALLIPLIAGAAYFFLLREPASTTATATGTASTDQLLAQAEEAARAGRYFEPAATAAVPKFRRVLDLDPGNARAKRGLNEIADQLINRAEHAMEAKKFDEAEALLKQAEQVDAAHPMLFSRRLALTELRQKASAPSAPSPRPETKTEVATKSAPVIPRIAPTTAPAPVQATANADDTRAREQKLQSLLARFQDLVAPASLSATRAGLAQDLMAEALRLAPDDRRVRALPDQLAGAYLTLAAGKVDEKDYPDAEALVRRGLELRPDDRKLQALQKEIADKKSRKTQTFGSF